MFDFCHQLISAKLSAFSLLLRLHLFANELFFHFLQPPTVETETIKFNPDLTETPISTKNVPIVKTETRKVSYQKDGLDGHRESEEGVLVSSQAHSSKTQTIETTTVSPTPPPPPHHYPTPQQTIDARYSALLIILTCAPPLDSSHCGHPLFSITADQGCLLSLISFVFIYIYIYNFFFFLHGDMHSVISQHALASLSIGEWTKLCCFFFCLIYLFFNRNFQK